MIGQMGLNILVMFTTELGMEKALTYHLKKRLDTLEIGRMA
jgi:hypothetical protein